jgi:hypothetical protein
MIKSRDLKEGRDKDRIKADRAAKKKHNEEVRKLIDAIEKARDPKPKPAPKPVEKPAKKPAKKKSK